MRTSVRVLVGVLSAGLLLNGSLGLAGTATFDFTTDPALDPNLLIVGNNPEPWKAAGGNPEAGGFLAITYPIGSQYTGVLFPDIDPGRVVTSFTFACDLRVGNGSTARPADGFSISFARASDPLIEDLSNTGNFAGGVPEAGSTTGIAISFDTWSGNTLPDGADIEGIIVRVDNVTVLRQSLPTRHGACADITSLQTGPRDADYWAAGGDPQDPASWVGLCWQPFSIALDDAGRLTVRYKGNTILNQFQTTYFPSPGRLILAGRTGGANEHTHVDNIVLTTVASDDTVPPSVPANLAGTALHPRRIKLTWEASTDNAPRVAYEVERGGTLLAGVLVTTTNYSDKVSPNTSYTYRVRAVDPTGNRSGFSAPVTVMTPVEVLTLTSGVMKFEAYTGIPGVLVDDLRADPKFPDSPDDGRVVGAYEGITGYGDNYGARVSGFITPAETANYIFLMSADDQGELWLSTNEDPANKVQIATEPVWNGVRQWTVLDRRDPDFPENRSLPIRLVAGTRYYTELLYKEGGGGDNGAVTWIKEGDPLPANGSPALRGGVISALVDPNQGPPSILEQPRGATAAIGSSATFTVSAIGTQPLSYQWRFVPLVSVGPAPTAQDIPGATGQTLEVRNLSAANMGFYSVVVRNDEGSATSAGAMVTLEGTLFIEAEDFNFGGGQYITNMSIGMTGPYPGGDFRDLGSDLDAEIDWVNPGGNAGQPYRSTTGVAAGKPNAHAAGLPRGSFDVLVNHVVGWNDPGDWQNYTRVFPTPARDYNVVGRLSSGGSPIDGDLDEVTSGATTPTQALSHIGVFRPGRATAGWDNLEWFWLTDTNGNKVTVNVGGERTIRFTTLPGANLDLDYLMFVPAVSARDFSIGLNFGADEVDGSGSGTLAATAVAGVGDVAQGNWNNLRGASGTSNLVADVTGTAQPTTATVTWSANNTWSSTGRGTEENNMFTGPNRTLMTGYLDSGSATTTSVIVASIPAELTSARYDVYVHAMGGVGGRGGSYRILDADSGIVLKDWVRAVTPTNSSAHIKVPTNLGGTVHGLGNYILFTGLTAANIHIEARTGTGFGTGATQRGPINAVQLVTPSTAPEAQDVTRPGDPITSIPGTIPPGQTVESPANEPVANAIDNRAATKYLNFNELNTGFTVTPSAGASIVTGLGLTSANDAPARDPATYRLEGSNDGTTYTLISEGTVPAFGATRFFRVQVDFANSTAYTSYRLVFPTVVDAASANSMQIAEVELLGTVTAAPAGPRLTIVRSAVDQVTITFEGTLQAADVVTGPYTPVAGATSPHTAPATAAARFYRSVQ